MSKPILEVIVCSLSDALAAERGGADRLEVISQFEVGGLTPPISVVREIAEQVDIPLRVMVRGQAHFAAPRGIAREELIDQAGEIAQLRVEGFVLGFLENGAIDEDFVAEVLSCGPALRATFHRAIESVESIVDAVQVLKKCRQIDRILYSGGEGDASVRAARLAAIADLAVPEMRVIAGGGLDERAINVIRDRTSIHEFHVGRAARIPPEIDGAVDEEKVRQLVRLTRG